MLKTSTTIGGLPNSPLSVGVWRRPSCLLALVARTNNGSYKLHVQSESWKYMYVKRYRSRTDMNKSCAINVDSISQPVTLKQY